MNCKRLNPEAAKVPDRGKKQVTEAKAPTSVGNGASSSGTLRYVQVVPPLAAAPSAATDTVVPPPTAAIPNDNTTAVVPQPSAATSHEIVPHNDAAGPTPNNLQDFSEPIPQVILPRLTIPVLELAEHAGVQLSSETAPLPVNRKNDVQTLPTHLVFSDEHGEDYDDDDVDIMLDEDNIAVAASKDTHVSIPLDLAAVHVPSQALSIMNPSVGSLDGDVEHDISIQDGTEVHSSARIQHDLELWRRVKEYDQKAAEVPFIPVLTRKQKQHLKKTTIDKPYKTRSMGGNSTSSQ